MLLLGMALSSSAEVIMHIHYQVHMRYHTSLIASVSLASGVGVN